MVGALEKFKLLNRFTPSGSWSYRPKSDGLKQMVSVLQKSIDSRGWSGGAMVLGKLPVPGRPTILITVGQGPIALAVGEGGGGLGIFTLIYPFSSFSLSLGDGPI